MTSNNTITDIPGKVSGGINVLIIQSGNDIGSRIATVMKNNGASVVMITTPESQPPEGIPVVLTDFNSHSATKAAVVQSGAFSEHQYDLVILCHLPLSDPKIPIIEMTPATLRKHVSGPLKNALFSLQCVCPALDEHDGTVIFLGPAFSLVGAKNMVGLTTVAEGQRALMKSVARQYGARGVRFHWLNLALDQLGSSISASDVPCSPEMGPPPPAIGRTPYLESEIIPVIEFLGSAGAKGLTGTTLCLDGGEWMVP